MIFIITAILFDKRTLLVFKGFNFSLRYIDFSVDSIYF